jgi:prolyl-tRNA synthetase
MTYTETELDAFIETAKTKPGYIKAMWCGDLECELKLKEVADVSSRCMPFGAEPVGDKCICCGKEAHKLVYWGKAY